MPNAIPATPPATAAPPFAASGPGGRLGRDEFLRLLTAQLRHQDPLNPLQGHELAADLAQFSGLEQLLNISETLQAQAQYSATLLHAMNSAVAMGAIGRTVVADSDQVVLAADGSGAIRGTAYADITVAGNARLVVIDQNGHEVRSQALGVVGVGDMQSFTIDGTGLTPGAYRVRIEVTDDSGAVVSQQTYFQGLVDGLSYGPDGATLNSGPVAVPIGSIRRITD